MSGFVIINKRTFLQDFLGIILIFVSMLLQTYYFFGYTDQGSLYQLIKGKEFLIYVFNAFVYLYVFWKLCCKCKRTLSIVFALLVPIIYSLHVAVYHVSLKLASTTSPETANELFELTLKGIKDDVANSCAKYIVVFVLMLAICLFVAIVTPKTIKHKIHIMRKRIYNSEKSLVNIGCEFNVVKALGDKLILSQGEGDNDSNLEYAIKLEVRDCNDQSVYLVFTDHELDDNNNFTYYVGKRDRKKGLLCPVKRQEVFDSIEKLTLL